MVFAAFTIIGNGSGERFLLTCFPVLGCYAGTIVLLEWDGVMKTYLVGEEPEGYYEVVGATNAVEGGCVAWRLVDTMHHA